MDDSAERPDSPGLPNGVANGEDEAQGDDGKRGEDQNAVSLLQEDIQRHSLFSPHAKILTWNFQRRLQEDELLQFRAVVSFVFGEAPHHFCGDWQTSKKKAQRDTAERVRNYLEVSNVLKPSEEVEGGGGASIRLRSTADAASLPEGVVEELKAVASGEPRSGGTGEEELDWAFEQRAAGTEGAAPAERHERLKATVTFRIHGFPHRFCGSWCADEGSASRDTAERVLWYFRKGEQRFAVSERVVSEGHPLWAMMPPQSPLFGTASVASSSAVAPASTAGMGRAVPSSPPAAEVSQSVEERTILMQVQNQLQKLLAKDTPPGSKVWSWSYDEDPHDPQLFRARVQITAWRSVFSGDWCRGKKLAQRNACLEVKRALDRMADGGQPDPR
mmetsp:Transcript_90679/g.236150  ORF Transcript_90679/g.236150 Transcript_90679/m.236150 type:complete len:388 (+) Transcript_90679:199-1362(+)